MDGVPVTRALLSALLLAGSLLVATPGGATAAPDGRCPQSREGIDQLTMKADDVFTATVDKRTGQGRTVVYDVTVDRVYKGDLDTVEATVSTPSSARECGLPDLRSGTDYVFFTAGADLETTSTSGTAQATDARVGRIERLLGEGRSVAPVEPAEATFTRVAGERTSFERLAAPGAALAIVGVLGLLLVAGLGRRRA